jgi:hypothetical protein
MKLLSFALIIFSFTSINFAQNAEQNFKIRQLDEKLKIGITPDSLNAILEAGKSGDRSFIPYLRKLALQPENSDALHTASSYAQIALASLGEEEYISSILKQVDDENIFRQNIGIQKLAYVKGKIALKTFYRLLDDTKYRVETLSPKEIEYAKKNGLGIRKGDEMLEPRSILAMEMLVKIVPNPPISPGVKPTIQDIEIWKQWFITNKYLIE